jgi:tetratricopeptide (TPR) repeat protein
MSSILLVPGNWSNGFLALAYLYSGDLPAARAAAEIARQYDEPENNQNVLALLGLIALQQEDIATAQGAFVTAVQKANALLAHSVQNYNALDTKGLVLAGLALCEGSHHVPAAIEAYSAARAINKDAGIIKRVLRLFDVLTKADSNGVLKDVRAAAAREPVAFQ